MAINELLSTAWRRVITPHSFFGQASQTFITNMMISGLGLVTGLLTARLLGPQGRGELAAIQLWPQVVATLAMLGMVDAVIYFASRFPAKSGSYLVTSFVPMFIAGVWFTILGWFVLPILLWHQSNEIITAARWFLILIVPLYALTVPQQSLRAVNAWRQWNILRVVPGLVWLVILCMAFFVPSWNNAIFLGMVYPLLFVALIVPSLVVVRNHFSRPFVVNVDYLKPLLRFGIPSMLTFIPNILNLRLDQLLMTSLVEPRMLGTYVAAVAWSGAMGPAFAAVGQVLFPRLSAIRDINAQRETFYRVIRWVVLSLLILTVILVVITPVCFTFLFGAIYSSGISAAILLTIAAAFSSLNSILGDSLRGLGKPRNALASEVAGLVVTVILLPFFLAKWEIVGAALASLASYMTISGVSLVFIQRAFKR